MSSPIISDLSGTLPLGEKWKNVNQIVVRTESHEVDKTLNDCKDQPTSLFNLLKFLLADKFHRLDLMFELLSAGDTTLLNKILSKRWMYEGEDNILTDSQFLLEQLFPKVSYICRRKLLHRIGRFAQNEVQVDQLWSAVEQMHGFDVAFPLFEACSRNVITSVIANREIQLSGYQVVTLLQKHPDIGLEYFKNHFVESSKMNPKCSPLHYLYKHRPDDFLDLYFNHSYKLNGFKIGRNRSTEFIRAHRVKLLEHPGKTSSLLKLDRIQREFSPQEYQKLFESTLPQVPSNAEEYWTWVCKAPKYKQVNMLNEAYANLYKIDLNKHPKHMNDEYIFLLPEERRLQVVEWKVENAEKSSSFLSWSLKGLSESAYKTGRSFLFLPLKPISYSAPELKKLLLIEQNVEMRATLCGYLIQTCYLNDDLPELLNVLKLLSKRTKNDQAEVRRKILSTIENIMEMEFSKEHWDVIMEIIQVALVFKDDLYDVNFDRMIRKHIAFRLKSKLPLEDLVTMHIKFKIEQDDVSFGNKYIKNPADERVILELYAKELERLHITKDLSACDGNTSSSSDTELLDYVWKLLDKIWRFNRRNKGSDIEPISLAAHPWLISNFQQMAIKEELKLDVECNEPATLPPRRKYSKRGGYDFWQLPNKLLRCIKWLRNEQNQVIDAFHGSDYYFSKMWLCLPNHQTILHFLKENPSHLLANWTASIDKMLGLKACVALMRTLKDWNYSSLVSQTVNDCLKLVRDPFGETPDEVAVTRKCNALLVLSTLMEPSDFLALTAEFCPTESKVDVFADKSDQDYEMKKALARSLINISTPHVAFDVLRTFSAGDYLKLVIDSFYSQMQRAQSTMSVDFLRPQLVNVPVSLHKHILRLFCAISTIDEKLEALKSVESSNVSIRNVVFLQLGKLFRSHPNQETWTLLKNAIDNTTAEDATILKFLYSTPELHTCPSEYITDYTSSCLNVLRKLKPSEVDTFMEHLIKIMKKVPAHLLDTILMHDIENAESFDRDFCVEYLKNSSSEQILEHRLSNIWRVLDSVIRLGWDRKSASQENETQSLVLWFVDDLADEIYDSSDAWLGRKICQTLLDKFTALSTTKFFLEILTLRLALLHVDVVGFSGAERLQRFGSSFGKFVDYLVDNFGNEIVLMSTNIIKSRVDSTLSTGIAKSKNVVVEFIDEVLKTSRTRANQIVAIRLLKEATPNELLEKITRIFIESDDVVIQTYYASMHRST